ncbi:WYL domain-containing protein [Leucobacter sp. CSA1]|uniref:WYL domain-containing protein n=1 Tax=Leucobacter chromiisoli TaxID=2796471 RepID=A0A934UV54_9MICO|nr:WYL domain-containing protein [Leucobacter chromiisoli]MBK0419106.1 WYL domain-containing protein [Leucobacter chromiisoli]
MRDDLTTADRVVLLLALVPYLDEHGPTPLAELAEAFDVDAEQLRGLVRFLGTAGVPGETLSYQHEDLFDIDWSALEDHDVVSLTRIVAVDDAPRFAPAETAALIAGLQSLTAMLPEADAEIARRTAAKLGAALDAPDRPTAISVTADPQDARVPVLVAAMDAGRQVAFGYRDALGAETRRTVDPLRLSQGAGVWYLRAFCRDRDGERTFRVDRMTDPRVLAEAAEHHPAAAPDPTPSPRSEGRAGVLARVRETALARIAGFGPQVVRAADPGWVSVRVELGHPRTAVALVQHAPGEVIVEEPAEAREAVRTWAERALAQYDA